MPSSEMTKSVPIPHPGLRARDARRRRGLTLDRVAELSALSKGYLSRFERGEKTLSVAALIRLGSALDVSIGTLLGEEVDNGEIHLLRANDTPPLTASSEDGSYVFHALSGNFDGQTHSTFLLDIPVDRPHSSRAFHGGRELLLVLEGSIEMSIGKNNLQLGKGDYLEFPGSIPHTISSPSDPSRILLVIVDSRDTAPPALSS